MAKNISAVVGIQWGDEGKGRMIDYLAQDADMVIRYQGGNNAGHTVVNQFGTFKLHLIPSGIFNPRSINLLGTGMVINLEALADEIKELESKNIDTSNIRVSDRATLTLPYHILEDAYEEERLGGSAYGSTKRGIAPSYGDRYLKKALLIGDVMYPDFMQKRLREIINWKNLIFRNVYKKDEINFDETYEWITKFSEKIKPLICNTHRLIDSYIIEEKKILFEAQLGALRDIFYGIYPFTTSSSVLSNFANAGGSMFSAKINNVIGVMKSFSTCVGAGPFVTEMDGEISHKLREIAYEYGAATGRPRRIGHFDAVASKYGCKIQGAHSIAITKLDSLSQQDELLICTAYDLNGISMDEFPINAVLEKVKPVYYSMQGWNEDISHIRDFDQLPQQAKDYVLKIEELIGVPVKYVSVGPERDSLIVR
ncbi:MAG: adenylosuccinate synthase [Ignavibacteriaceae bacterium]|jgi:adenylosuccinate synthase|nr:MAG: adenylosuccinate synthase [Chlorobiota bacterium]KXK06131.1 MAG: adenylosuccinate synthetase [Chlorobi bacterium OLB4]MBV6398560.1 Adenylosuccinate synthetase [Ignavibacteria bacterium]MCC6885794.1 adenylosuccinate synthase [Ignavibacteriales bacterium]MCE7953011.1 adenylosuccinate synthase [Chlorobi bacterium CHB7]MDL1887151.1 adenylosuccinate synthase [Ignavibacteria bacterium CHB1]MEB2329206.1 adenylosuccinate synthase [Ignavibacteriaceae bacterium]OQY78044.1 MAG: adenylosuccinate